MEEPLVWAFIWLVTAVGFAAAEMLVPGSFFFAPFAVGGGAAAAASFMGAPVWISFPLFLIVSVGAFMAIRPYAQRLDETIPQVIGVGANRLIGESGVVISPIDAGRSESGLVKVGGEEWVAQMASGIAAVQDQDVRVLEVRGTTLIVESI